MSCPRLPPLLLLAVSLRAWAHCCWLTKLQLVSPCLADEMLASVPEMLVFVRLEAGRTNIFPLTSIFQGRLQEYQQPVSHWQMPV
jgi:hypothetical protein